MPQPNWNYPELFTAIGKFIAEKNLQQVCVMEFEDGVIVTGSLFYESSEGSRRIEETIVLSRFELEKMLQGKRGLLRRLGPEGKP